MHYIIRSKNGRLVFRQGVDDGCAVVVADVDEAVHVHSVLDRTAVSIADSDERPVDAIEDGTAVSVALMYEPVIIDGGDDGSKVSVPRMDEPVHIYRCHNRRAVGVTPSNEAPTLPIAVIRFVVFHISVG